VADIQYLYLLFDIAPSILTNQVFTTEGHALSLPHSQLRPPSTVRRQMHKGENQFCPAYKPPTLGGLVVGIERRRDYEYARALVFGGDTDGLKIEDEARVGWWEGGWCEKPVMPKFVSLTSVQS
jgi:mannosidase alpha-like ER degradation enhancer 1